MRFGFGFGFGFGLGSPTCVELALGPFDLLGERHHEAVPLRAVAPRARTVQIDDERVARVTRHARHKVAG